MNAVPSFPDRDKITLQQLADAYLSLEAPKLSAKAREETARHILLFIGDLGQSRPAHSVRRIEVALWLQGHTEFRSSHTRKNAIASVKRLFSWGEEMELCDKNPCWRLRIAWGEPSRPRRPMTDAEFRQLLRKARPYMRRLLYFLAFTGARPAEARTMKWENVNLESGMVKLAKHKTGYRTGKPRVLFLPPVLVKLLTWMKGHSARTWHGQKMTLETTSKVLRQILSHGPITAKELHRRLRPQGVSYRMVNRAKETIGAEFRWLGQGKGGIYWLPDRAKEKPLNAQSPFVFLHERGEPWGSSHTLCRHLARLRKRIGLAEDVTLYLLRHGFATMAIKKGVPLKMVSELLGHSRTSTTELCYLHTEVMTDELHEAARQTTAGIFPGNAQLPRHGLPEQQDGKNFG